MSFYILATLFVIACALYGQLTWWTSVIMLLIYVALVVTVYIQDKQAAKQKDEEKAAETEAYKPPLAIEGGERADVNASGNEETAPMLKKSSKMMAAITRKITITVKREMNLLTEKRKVERERKAKEFSAKACWEKVSHIIEFPFDWIRKLTILPCEAQHYDKIFVIIWPYFGILVAEIIVTKKWPTTWKYWVYLAVAICWSILFYCIKGTVDPDDLEEDDEEEDKKDEGPKKVRDERYLLPGNWFMMIAIIGMIWGFLWTYFVSGMMIDILTFVGVLSKLSATYLALTIIAVGNALPDALLTIALASKGKADLGITGGYAGQLFGLLVGFGLAMLKKSLTEKDKIVFNLFSDPKDNMLDIVVIFTALVTLTVTFVYGICNKMQFDKRLAYIFAGIYGAFFIACTVIACIKAYK